MFRVGLTGGIGSGKSTVAELFAERGVAVIDMDILSREVVQPGQPALEEIKAVFGNGICNSHDELDRKRLRQLVFADSFKRLQLEAITHPRIRQRVEEIIQGLSSPYCIIVIPLLFETGQHDTIDRVLVVDVEPETQVSRTMQRDNIDEDYVKKILASQVDRQVRLKAADDIIVNHGQVSELTEQVEQLHQKYLELARKHG